MSKGSCSFCGEKFDNVFEAVDHLDEQFNPAFIVSEKVRLKLGDALYGVYVQGSPELKEWAEELFAVLYVAEKRPVEFPAIYASFSEDHHFSMQERVYQIVGEDSFKKLNDELVEEIKDLPSKRWDILHDWVRQVELGLLSRETFNQKASILFGGSGK